MSGGILRTHVHVIDDQGQRHVFAPGIEVPDWAAAKITNPKAWAEAPEAPGTDGGGQSNSEPPRSGKGSGRDAWSMFAAERDVQVPEGASREEIIAACEAAGVVEPAE